MNKPKKNHLHRSFAERVSLTISLSIFSLLIILICYTWFTGDDNPPVLSVNKDVKIRQVEQQFYVPFTVSNSGGATAESVEVVAKLLAKNGDIETARQEIDFLSRKEKRQGEFIFINDPQQGELTVRVASYKLP